jgi:transposase
VADRLRAADRWSADGTWARLLARAQTDADAAGELDWLVAVDSTVVRVHQHGASARRVGGNAATVSLDEPEEGAAAGQRAGGFLD